MNRLKIIFFAAILGLAFVCNGCSMIYYLYFRNFSDKTLTIRVVDPADWHKSYRKYYVRHSILRIKRNIDLNKFDSAFAQFEKNEILLSIPPKSTVFLGYQPNNSSFMRNRMGVPRTIVLLEHNG